jgi:hypothetical protein
MLLGHGADLRRSSPVRFVTWWVFAREESGQGGDRKGEVSGIRHVRGATVWCSHDVKERDDAIQSRI